MSVWGPLRRAGGRVGGVQDFGSKPGQDARSTTSATSTQLYRRLSYPWKTWRARTPLRARRRFRREPTGLYAPFPVIAKASAGLQVSRALKKAASQLGRLLRSLRTAADLVRFTSHERCASTLPLGVSGAPPDRPAAGAWCYLSPRRRRLRRAAPMLPVFSFSLASPHACGSMAQAAGTRSSRAGCAQARGGLARPPARRRGPNSRSRSGRSPNEAGAAASGGGAADALAGAARAAARAASP